MAALFYHTPIAVHHIELQPAELGALSPIGTPPEAMLRHVALSAVTDTERPVYKDLQRHVASRMHGLNLGQRQFTRQHHLAEPQTVEELHLLRCTVVHLRAGMQRDGRKVEFQQSHVLHDERIHSGTIQRPHQPFRLGQFLVLQYRIDRDVHFDTERMGILHQTGDVLHGIARRCPCPETGSTDIHGICPVVHCRHGTFHVAGRSQKLYWSLSDHRILLIS